MKVPPGFHSEDSNGNDISEEFCLELLKNYCRSYNATANWCTVLSDSLEERGFKKCAINPCLFIREDFILVTCAYDYLTFYEKKEVLFELIESLKDDFKLIDKGDLELFLSVQFKKADNSVLKLLQSHLIGRIVDALGLKEECKMHNAPSNIVLTKDIDSEPRRQS